MTESCSVMSDSYATPWTIQSMEFSVENGEKQKNRYLSIPDCGDLPDSSLLGFDEVTCMGVSQVAQ